jgi:hypothetical protein
MSLLTGRLSEHGAVADVMVGISDARARLLKRNGRRVPGPVHARVQVDTGSSLSGFAPRVFNELGVTPVRTLPILTPSTPAHSPHVTQLYDVVLYLVINARLQRFYGTTAIGADCFSENEGIEGLIGRDVLDHCSFWYHGIEGTFTLGA